MNNDGKVFIFDTTLRDGQQCPGAGMSFEKNIEYAHLAAKLGIDVLEAGFPSASKLDFEISRKIAEELGPQKDAPIIAGLCQLREEQIIRTIEALSPAVPYQKARLHVYIPVDPNLMEASLGERAKDKAKIVSDVHRLILLAAQQGLEVEMSPEGYSRMGGNFSFVTDLIRASIDAGASVINCPDTIGGAAVFQGKEYFVEYMKQHAAIMEREFPGRTIIWSVHCHNDFGLATQNSLHGVFYGPARQVEGCINGIGERAGNASIEQVVMAIRQFGGSTDLPEKRHTTVRTEMFGEACDFVRRNMLPVQPHWPISGDNAMRHSAGGHTNAILNNPLVYQPFNPEDVGRKISLVFGPLSGGNHSQSIIEAAGFQVEESEKAAIAQYIKDLYADRRKGITDEEVVLGYVEYRSPMKISDFDYARSSNRSSVTMTGRFFSGESTTFTEAHEGKDSALAALKKMIDQKMPGYEIQSHKSASDGEGIGARSVSRIVVINEEGDTWEGVGEDRDIEISAMKALVSAMNRAYIHCNYATSS